MIILLRCPLRSEPKAQRPFRYDFTLHGLRSCQWNVGESSAPCRMNGTRSMPYERHGVMAAREHKLKKVEATKQRVRQGQSNKKQPALHATQPTSQASTMRCHNSAVGGDDLCPPNFEHYEIQPTSHVTTVRCLHNAVYHYSAVGGGGVLICCLP